MTTSICLFGERLVAQPDRHLQVFLELHPVLRLEPGQPVLAVAEFGTGAELQLLRHLRQVGQRLELVLRGGLRAHDHVVAVVHRLVQHDEALRRVLGLDLVVDGLAVRHRLRLEHGEQHRSRVFGIEVDLLFLERLVRDQRAAEVDLALDLDAGRLERLRVELGDDELLGEVLRADLDLRQRGCGGEQQGGGRRGEHAKDARGGHGNLRGSVRRA